MRIKVERIVENFKLYFESSKSFILNKLQGNPIYVFVKRRHEWVNSSLKNYSIFLFWGSTSLAIVRLFQIWVTNSWDLINLYYITITISFSFTFFLISLRYFKEKGYFKRGDENKEKWRAYQDFVAKKHNVEWNFKFSRCLLVLLALDFAFTNFYRDYHVGETLSNIGMFTSSFIFFCYIVNHCYIYYWMRKTPVPDELLFEPPSIYIKLASIPQIEKILTRKYSTRTRFERFKAAYSNNKKEVWATTLGIATVLFWATGTDRSIADYNQETSYGSRVYTTTKGGWYTQNPRIRTRTEQLIRWGIDPTDLCYEDSKRLNEEEVNSTYERIKDEKYPKPYKAEIKELKSNLEATQSNLEATQSNLEAAYSEIARQAERNNDLERRLVSLEKGKEIVEYK